MPSHGRRPLFAYPGQVAGKQHCVVAFLLVVVGAGLVALALADVFYTVLFPGSGRGPVRRVLSRAVLRAFRLTRHMGRSRAQRAMAYCGPVHVAATLGVWFVLLLTGWAAIYRPALGSGVVAATGTTQRTWATALYYSGYTLTTLGLGDIVAVTPAYRAVTVVEAATGFISFTLVISYFVSVYTTLTARNAFALALHQRSGGTGRGVDVVRALVLEGPTAASLHLAEVAGELRRLVQTDASYPVLRSFHYRRDYDALPQILQTCWETVTLLQTTVAPDAARPELHGSSVSEMAACAEQMCARIAGAPPSDTAAPTSDHDAWMAQHASMAADLAAAGSPVRSNAAAAYVAAREVWSPALDALAHDLLYQWPRPGEH
jgi:hypothetical protein